MFLEEASIICPEGPLDKYRGHWLFLQLRPEGVAQPDVFDGLTSILNKASNEYLGVKGTREANKLSSRISHRGLPRLYFILDEAQIPARLHRDAYRSANDDSMQRPILGEIVSAWDKRGHIILSGTGLSMKEVQDAVGSQVLKNDILRPTICTKTGAFDSPEAQSSYISRYLLPNYVQGISGQSLLDRCWSWL